MSEAVAAETMTTDLIADEIDETEEDIKTLLHLSKNPINEEKDDSNNSNQDLVDGSPPQERPPVKPTGRGVDRKASFNASATTTKASSMVNNGSSSRRSIRSILASSSSAYNDGIHSAFTYLATCQNTPLWKQVAAFFASWLMVIWQLLLYSFIVGESTKPHCLSDEFCREGQVCNEDSFCGIPNQNYTDVNGDGVLVKTTPPAEEDCPYLAQCNTWSSRLAIIFILVFIIGSIIDDLDQNARIYRAGLYRLQQILSSSSLSDVHRRHRFIAFNIWALHYVRAYLIPYATFCATIAIIYAEGAVSTQTVILNGLAVSFICSFDDALFGLLVPPNLQIKSGTAMESANDLFIQTNDYETQESRIWIFQRVMCTAYAIVSCWVIFNPIEAIKKSPSLFLTNPSYHSEYASCDDFYSAITAWPTVMLVAFCCVDKVVVMAPMRIVLRDFFLGPIFVIIFWGCVFLAMLTIYTAQTC